MTPDRTAWLAERRTGIGGSDAASLLGIGWGCQRRLWYDKRGTPEDYPLKETAAMSLGSFLESWFADTYAHQSHRLVEVEEAAHVHPMIPELRVNIDRWVWRELSEAEERGVLEIKSCGRGAYYKYVREGLPVDYIAQLQHAMLVTGAGWGSFAIGCRDNGDLKYWDVNPSAAIQKAIFDEASLFWQKVENGPAPEALEPDDPRCSRCAWRRTCQGNALISIDTGEIPAAEELRPLLSEYLERKGLLEEAEDLFAGIREELKATLGDRQAVTVGASKIYYRPQAGHTLYKGKELLEAYRKVREYMLSILKKLPNDEGSALLKSPDYPIIPPVESFTDVSKPSRPLRIF